MSFLRYESCKDSGIEWLGEVPRHWSVLALKRSFAIVGGATPNSDIESYWDGDVQWITPADLGKSTDLTITETRRQITEKGLASCAAELVPPNTVILSTRAPIGSIGITRQSACTNQGCKSLVNRGGYNSQLLAYVLAAANGELNIRGKGTTFLELSGDELGRFSIPTPPISEQQQITAFLDHETTKIDALVEEQRLLIELLKEKRQALISAAVTGKIDVRAQVAKAKAPEEAAAA
jgi:type I restriction enzyme, S subunit